jgi:ACT domain-containing protein
MKKLFIIPFMLALFISSGCHAEQQNKTQGKPTKSVICYSGNIKTYQNANVILVAAVVDTDISARIKEVDTGITMRVPISQCYFKDN